MQVFKSERHEDLNLLKVILHREVNLPLVAAIFLPITEILYLKRDGLQEHLPGMLAE